MLIPGQNKIAILGPGAVGGFLASVLWKNGADVTCVAKEAAARLINEQGIDFRSLTLGDFIARPKAVTELREEPEILFITTKATALSGALNRINLELVKNAVIVPLLNGLEHMVLLRQYFGPRLAAGSISIEVSQPALGMVFHSSSFARIKLVSDQDIAREQLEEIICLFKKCGLEAELGLNEAAVLWEKLARLNAIACSTAATDKPIGFLRSDPFWRKKLLEMIGEAVSVAAAEGVAIDADAVMAKIDSLEPAQLTSLQRDVSQGKESELDAIAGAIVRAGARHGLTCPTIEHLIALIQKRINERL